MNTEQAKANLLTLGRTSLPEKSWVANQDGEYRVLCSWGQKDVALVFSREMIDDYRDGDDHVRQRADAKLRSHLKERFRLVESDRRQGTHRQTEEWHVDSVFLYMTDDDTRS
jgi:hypothetical protein